MGGGLMQLVAYGAQDIYLTGNPQITFFKVVYRRHTNFSMEAIQQTFSGTSSYGNKATATISRNGDLVSRMYVEHSVTVADSAGSDFHLCNNYGHALLKEVELEIGGQRIDKHYGRWMETWANLTEVNPTAVCAAPVATTLFGETAGNTLFNKMSGNTVGVGRLDTLAADGPYIMNIPLQFWFCRNPGLALPLIALQYHEVKVSIQFENQQSIINDESAGTACVTASSNKLWVDYIYLDTDERRRFAQQSHEYLIEQLQYQTFSSTGATGNHVLNFNHPVKELVWQFGNSACETTLTGAANSVTAGDTSTLAAGCPMITGEFKLKLNGHDRFAQREFRYFTRAQVYQHHTGAGQELLIGQDAIGVYSFALKPEEHQPSGTCNFSRIDNATFEINTAVTFTDAIAGDEAATTLHVYAVNYNVLRVMSGMGGLAYSN
jgi:hypothetical protein